MNWTLAWCSGDLEFVLVSFPVAWIKTPWQKQLKGGWVYLSHSSRGVHHREKAWQQEEWGCGLCGVYNHESGSDGCFCWACPFHFTESRTIAHGKMTPTIQCLMFPKLACSRKSHGYAQRHLSVVLLETVKLAVVALAVIWSMCMLSWAHNWFIAKPLCFPIQIKNVCTWQLYNIWICSFTVSLVYCASPVIPCAGM